MLANLATMLHRALFAASLGCVLGTVSGHAWAAGAWLPSGTFKPVEQRVAVASGPDRTTLWTSLRFDASAGPVGIVVPAPPGASLDFSSDAWFEALDDATAPRIFPPSGVSPFCPGGMGPDHLFENTGSTGHTPSLKVDDLAVLDDVTAVSTWASQGGLDLAPDAEATLGSLSGVRFVALRFQAPGGAALTPTLRIAMPGAPPMLPLALTRASAGDLRVTTWLIGEQRGYVVGSTPVKLPPSSLWWEAKEKKSNYEDQRHKGLFAQGGDGTLLECAGHGPLVDNLSIAEGTASIQGIVTTFFERASSYGDANVDPSSCIAQAAVVLGQPSKVAASCPRADLGVIDGVPTCKEAPTGGEIDPAKLRCGGSSDDLAVALSSLSPAEAWLTRQTLEIPSGQAGADWSLAFVNGPAMKPILTAKGVDLSGCSGSSSSSSSTSAGPSSSSSSSSTVSVGAGVVSGGSQSSGVGSGPGSGGSGGDDASGPDVYVDTSCNCSGPVDTSGYDSSSDSCDSADTGGDSCDSSETGGDSCSSADGGDSCDSSSGGDSCDSGGGGESCDGGGGDVDCSGGGGDLDCGGGGADCSIGKGAQRRRGVKLSPIALSLIAVIAPLRRRGRRPREGNKR